MRSLSTTAGARAPTTRWHSASVLFRRQKSLARNVPPEGRKRTRLWRQTPESVALCRVLENDGAHLILPTRIEAYRSPHPGDQFVEAMKAAALLRFPQLDLRLDAAFAHHG